MSQLIYAYRLTKAHYHALRGKPPETVAQLAFDAALSGMECAAHKVIRMHDKGALRVPVHKVIPIALCDNRLRWRKTVRKMTAQQQDMLWHTVESVRTTCDMNDITADVKLLRGTRRRPHRIACLFRPGKK